jgi:hypothetical protein
VVAGDIVPLNSILIDIIEQAQAGLNLAVDILFSIVWLGYFEMTCIGPGLVAPSGCIGWGYFLVGSCPEPAIDTCRLQIGAVTTFEVANSTRGPNIINFV